MEWVAEAHKANLFYLEAKFSAAIQFYNTAIQQMPANAILLWCPPPLNCSLFYNYSLVMFGVDKLYQQSCSSTVEDGTLSPLSEWLQFRH